MLHIAVAAFGAFSLLCFVAGFAAGRWVLLYKNRGEAMVADAITKCFERPHVLLNNITLETGDGTTQIDHLLISDVGIFVIETKHYAGWIFGKATDSHWTQVIYKKKSRFQNPSRQNYLHLQTVKTLFTLPEDTFFAAVVFTGEAEFKSDLGPNVFRLPQFVAYLAENRPVIFDERKMVYIIGRIEMKRLRRSLETDEYHLNFVRRKIEARRIARAAKVSGSAKSA